MVRKLALLFFAGMLLYGTGTAWQAFKTYPPVDLVEVFRSSGAAVLEVNVDTWCEVPQVVTSAKQAGIILERALTGMSITDYTPISLNTWPGDGENEDSNAGTYEAKVEVTLPTGAILMAKVDAHNGTENYTILLLSLMSQEAEPDLGNIYQFLARGPAALGLKPQRSTQLVGVINGRLSPEQAALVVTAVMSSAGAEMKSIYSDGNVVTLSGYSDRIEESTQNHSGSVNLNLAMRYNEEENRTWVFLASPALWEPI